MGKMVKLQVHNKYYVGIDGSLQPTTIQLLLAHELSHVISRNISDGGVNIIRAQTAAGQYNLPDEPFWNEGVNFDGVTIGFAGPNQQLVANEYFEREGFPKRLFYEGTGISKNFEEYREYLGNRKNLGEDVNLSLARLVWGGSNSQEQINNALANRADVLNGVRINEANEIEFDPGLEYDANTAGSDLLIGRDYRVNANNEVVREGQLSNYLSGGGGADYLFGGLGNDYLYGGDGNDVIWGGEGEDVAIFTGNRDNYRVSFVPSEVVGKVGGSWEVEYLPSGDVDIVKDVERFAFGIEYFEVNGGTISI